MAPALHVQMLGGFGVRADERDLPSLGSRAASSLLAYLVLNRDRPQTRDLLAGRFWSDLPEDKARRQLSNALWRIRKTLDPEVDGRSVIDASTNDVRLSRDLDLRVDVEVFERRLDELTRRRQADRQSVSAANLADVVESYRGDLLSGYYDEWINGPRERIRGRYLEAVVQLVRMHSRAGDYESSLRYARSLVEAEPLSDEWQRELIRLYALNGQPSAAEQHYERYAAHLKHELDARPGREITALMERIRNDAAAPPILEPPTGEERISFVGRKRERARLLERVNDLLDGNGGFVLVEGEAGAGKSRLMEEVASGAEWRNVQVLMGSHSATSTLTPFGGLRAALQPAVQGLRGERLATQLAPVWLRQASSVLPELSTLVEGSVSQSLRPEEEPWRTIEALTLVLLALGQAQPMLLVLEDIHWCDEDTLQVLTQMGDRLANSGLLICLTYQRHEAQKSDSLWRTLGSLEARPGSSRVAVGPLSDAEVRSLVAAELGPGRVSEPALAQLARSSAGNPFAVLELVRSSAGVLDEEFFRQVAEPGNGGGAAPWLEQVLAQRLDTTTDEVRQVLEGVAAVGGPASSGVVAQLTGMERLSVIDAMSDAVNNGFLVESDGSVEFAQEQSRQLVYEGIDDGRRRAIHGRIVDALVAEAGAGVEQLAYHAARAGHWHRAHQYASLAAESAVELNAFQTAAEHYSMADEAAGHIGIADADRVEDLLALERVLDVLGRRDAQQELLDRLDDLDPDLGSTTEVAERRAWLLTNTDQRDKAVELAQEAAELASARGHSTGELLTVVGAALSWSGDLEAAVAPLERALVELERDGASPVNAQMMLGRALAELLRLDEAQHHLEAASERAKADRDERARVEVLGHLAALYLSQQSEPQAEAAFLEALHLAIDIGYRHGEGLNLVNLVAFYALQDRGGKALMLVDRAEEVFTSLGNGRGVAFARNNGATLQHWLLGEDEVAATKAEAAAVYFRSVGDARAESTCLTTLASIDFRSGRRRLAKRRLEAARQQGELANDAYGLAIIHFLAAQVEMELGHTEAALEEVVRATTLAEEHALGALDPVLSVTEARVRAAAGELDAVRPLIDRSIERNRTGSYRAYLCAWWSATLLDQLGEESLAREQVMLAHEILSRNLEELPPSLVALAWTAVGEHREIAAAREKFLEETVEIRLPTTSTPTGRVLEDADFKDVVLTISHPDDWSLHNAARRRQQRIRRLMRQAADQNVKARVEDMARILKVSDRTIKRDLAELRDEGHKFRES